MKGLKARLEFRLEVFGCQSLIGFASATLLLILIAPAMLVAQTNALLVTSRIIQSIDENARVTLKGNVRQDLATSPDFGLVEDGKPLHLYLLLQRTAGQQADLDHLIARQQQPTAPEYHKWLSPQEFGARFGASPEDIAKITGWLESHGLQVRSVLNNASMIDFAATAGQVRDTFHTELHYFNVRGGKYVANVRAPQIPAALAPVVAGIKGLVKIPARANHTPIRQASYDAHSHRWHIVDSAGKAGAKTAFDDAADGDLDVTPQDFYTIYNVNPVFTGGHLAATATVAVIEESDMEYGTVNSTTGVATGGDVATFRSLFGVPGKLNMHVYHGYGTVTCSDPGIDPDGTGEDEEASLDAEWINATAPSANLIFMSCDQSPDNGIFSSMAALVDNSLSDVMSLSYGESELFFVASDYTAQDTLYAQAATQGQSIFISSGDSGSDVADQNTNGTATSGINVNAFGSPLVTVAGGTDFSDYYDASEGGRAQSTYWSSTNTTHYGSALGYVPETAWNDSCASSIYAVSQGFTGAGLCANFGVGNDGFVIGGSGGISSHYAVPAWQTGVSGYSNSNHAQPDVAGFASNGWWGHALIFCDSNPIDASFAGCTTEANFAEAGGTSFVAPYMAGVAGLLRDYSGSRQGLLNPALYALAKAQFTAAATRTACYSNGQTSNAGVTTGLPAAACIFNDVTTSNNDVPCEAGSTSCFVNSGDGFGMLSLKGSSSLAVAYPSTIGFDQVSGIGTVNVNNLITKWNTAFTSTTSLKASLTSITSSQSTVLIATVTGATPIGYVDTPPALTGKASFAAGTTSLGNCALSAGSCSLSVPGTALQSGANSVTATFLGSGTYPSSTSSIVTVTVTASSGPAVSLTPTSLNFGAVATGVTSPAETVTLKKSGNASLTITAIALTGTNSGDFLETTTCTSSLAAGASCTIKVQFKPSAIGARSAAVSIADNAAGSPQQVPLSGTGTAAELSPTSVSFGTLAVGLTSSVKTVTLKNVGTTAITITSIAVTGAEAGDFPRTATSCGSSLAAAASCTVSVTFKPTTTGARSANLTFTDNASGSPQQVSLSGTGTTAEITPTSVSFGSVTVGTTSAAKTVTLKNVSTTAITITSIAVTGAEAGDFPKTATSCGSSLAAGASCTMSVTFKPTTTGARSANLTFTDNASGSPQQVSLSGTGS